MSNQFWKFEFVHAPYQHDGVSVCTLTDERDSCTDESNTQSGRNPIRLEPIDESISGLNPQIYDWSAPDLPSPDAAGIKDAASDARSRRLHPLVAFCQQSQLFSIDCIDIVKKLAIDADPKSSCLL